MAVVYPPWAFGWLLLLLGGFWMAAWMVPLISWGAGEMRMPRELKHKARKMSSDLQILCHNLAHFCCAKFCLFLIAPSPVLRSHRSTATER